MNNKYFQSEIGKRITIVIDSMNGGGAESVCLDLSRNFIRRGYLVDLVLCEFRGNLLKQIPPEVNLFVLQEEPHEENGNNYCSIPNENINWIVPNNSIKYTEHVKHVVLSWPFGVKFKICRAHKRIVPTRSDRRARLAHAFSVYLMENLPDLVVAILTYSVFCTLVGRDISAISVPVICSIHNSQVNFIPPERKVNSALLRKADWVHSISKGITKELSELKWVDHQKITTIYNSVDKQRIEKLAKLPSGHPWLDNKVRFNHKVIMTVGRLARQKNHPLLIRSFANIARLGNFKLVILGERGGEANYSP